MGIRTDSDLQQPSIEDGHNPYTAEDLAVYSPQEIDSMCQMQDDMARLFDETRNLIEALSAGIDRLSPIIQDAYDNLKRMEEVLELEE